MFWTLKVSNQLGLKAEKEALSYLKKQGLTLLSKNFACKTGEIDLIMLHTNIIVFLEVRYRKKSTYGGAAESINSHKKNKIRKTAALYLQKNRQHHHRSSRFDVISITNDNINNKNCFQWIKGAF